MDSMVNNKITSFEQLKAVLEARNTKGSFASTTQPLKVAQKKRKKK